MEGRIFENPAFHSLCFTGVAVVVRGLRGLTAIWLPAYTGVCIFE